MDGDDAALDAILAGVKADGTPVHINVLLTRMIELGASDLHLSNGRAPSVRIDGSISELDSWPVMGGSQLRDLIYAILSDRQRERFEADLELDTSHSIPGVGRFRLNVFLQRDTVGAVLRAIPQSIVALEKLGLPPIVAELGRLQRGLVLVTGPPGSGKSTTLASLVDLVNTTRACHIMTVEDPIEFLHTHKLAVVNQREVGEDTHSFTEALKHVLRQDPDVILVGEMRDLETISTALTAAETGHLVFGTLHTQDAPQSIDRIIDVFPPTSSSRSGYSCLVPPGGNDPTAPADQVRKGAGRGLRGHDRHFCCPQPHPGGQGPSDLQLMQAGGRYGMQTMDMSLASLVTAGSITLEKALENCHQEDDVNRLVSGFRSPAAPFR